jgi:hypothetical protein
MGFEHMGFGEAVSYVQTVGVLIDLLLLSLPIAAAAAICVGKRNRPGAKLLFARFIFWGWFVLLGLAIAYFFTGAWYGENGPPPQTVAAQVTIALACLLVVVIVIYGGLYVTTRPAPSHELDAA